MIHKVQTAEKNKAYFSVEWDFNVDSIGNGIGKALWRVGRV